MFNEADTRVKLIDPKLHASGWKEEQILRERQITVGRIIDEEGARGAGKKADYVLQYYPSFPIAIVEAKDEAHTALDGVQQAKGYAQDLDVVFAYSCNGHQIEEFDRFTNKQQSLERFPTPDELWKKYADYRLKDAKIPTKNPFEVQLPLERGKEPRYYQEVAVRSIVEAYLKGKDRILLNMATGTGKTHVAFWTLWKLYNSGLIRRVLYVADRLVLRDQAYNWFGPFGDARAVIGDAKVPINRDIYFSTYQSLYSETEEGKRVFQLYDPNFFDIVVIDECHRSGFGTWHDILRHFSKAKHLGMTATPKRTDNIDTYAYFGNPVYSYSLGRGIDDGFLAPYKIHKVFTNIDKEGGISLKDIEKEGVKVYIPEEAETKDYYTTGEFEREILLPDRTIKICEHLANLLKVFEPMQKTMVFCVTNDHAALVTKEMQNRFAGLGYSDYAVRIVSEEADAREILERFVDSDKKTPVVASTVDLLTTGVDAPCVHNIVFLRPISSQVLFKQIIGRGSRIDPSTDKYYFRIIDYLNTTRLLDHWDIPEEDVGAAGPSGPFDWFLKGRVIDKETGDPVSNASIVVLIGPNQTAHSRTDEKGFFSFSGMPHGKVATKITATGYVPKEFEAKPSEALETSVLAELKKEALAKEKIKVEGLTIYIAQETYVEIVEGKPLTKAKYIEYSKDQIKKRVVTLGDLQRIWLDPNERAKFLEELKKNSVNPDVIAKLVERPDADTFDILARIAFDAPIVTRDERAKALMNLKSGFLGSFGPEAKEVLLMLLEKYRVAGVGEITSKVFEVPPFDKKGYILGIAKVFGGLDKLKKAISEVQKGLYSDFANTVGGR